VSLIVTLSCEQYFIWIKIFQFLSEMLQCQLPSWYSSFEDCTIKSRVIPLSPDFVDYLLTDGIVLPQSSKSSMLQSLDRSELSDDDDLVSVSSEMVAPSFPELEAQVEAVLAEFPAVFPKVATILITTC
jgi:hypothetical protein